MKELNYISKIKIDLCIWRAPLQTYDFVYANFVYAYASALVISVYANFHANFCVR